MKFKLKIADKEFEIEILEEKEGTKIKIGEKEFLFEENKQKGSSPPSIIPKRDFSKKEILAPIAGQISEIFVKEGDWVKKDFCLLTLSAMKMENEILAEKEGKIIKVFVKKGQKVKKDEKLIEIQ